MPERELNMSVEWDGRSKAATGFTTVDQADRFIRQICQKIAPDKQFEVITLIPL